MSNKPMILIRVIAAATALVVLGLAPGAARAATVTLEVQIGGFGSSTGPESRYVRVTGGAGADAITIAAAPTSVTVRDEAAALVAPKNCTQSDARTVVCPVGALLLGSAARSPEFVAEVALGAGDDVAIVSGAAPVSLAGGAGADRLTGGDSADRLDGGAGPDVISGGEGHDVLLDSTDDVADDDQFDGGPDGAEVVYRGRRGVIADLVAGHAGIAGERDRLSGVTGISTGRGADVLRGGPGRDVLESGRGKDVLYGRGGNDVLNLGIARFDPDEQDGSTYTSADRAADRVSCGAGIDHVLYPGRATRLARNCERAETDVIAVQRRPVSVRATRIRLRVRSDLPAFGSARLRLWVRAAGRTISIGRSTTFIAPARPAVRLTRAGRRLVAARGRRTVRATLIPTDEPREAIAFTLRI